MQRPHRHRDGDGRDRRRDNRDRRRDTDGPTSRRDPVGRPPPPYQPPPVDYPPNFYYQNPYPQFHPQQNHYYSNTYFQNPNSQFQNPNLQFQDPNHNAPSEFQVPIPSQNPDTPVRIKKQRKIVRDQSEQVQCNPAPPPPPPRRETLENIDAAVVLAWRELVSSSSESVSAYKVSQSAVLKLKAESWDSLGYKLQEVPSLRRLIDIEGRIDAFIHCYVAVRTVITLYDLELAICEDEEIEKFEELELGPLLRHPLAEHYFSSRDMPEMYKITVEEFMEYLKRFMVKQKGRSFQGSEVLEFVARRCKVYNWKKMGLRVQSLGKHIGYIRRALLREKSVISTCFKKGKNSGKKNQAQPPFSLERKQMDGSYNAKAQLAASFSFPQKDVFAQKIQFYSSSSDENDTGDDCGKDKYSSERIVSDSNKQEECRLSSQNTRSDKVSSCPYPSEVEDMVRLGLRGETDSSLDTSILKNSENDEPAKKKKKLDKPSCSIENTTYKGYGDALINESIRMFITTWKETCCHFTATKVFEQMMQYYDLTVEQKRNFKRLSSVTPFLGLLNVAVISIKSGSWDSIYDKFQSSDKHGCRNERLNKCIEHKGLDVGSSGKDLLDSTNQLSESGLSVTVEDILKKVREYFAKEVTLSGERNSLLETILIHARKLLHCEVWLSQQYCVKEFGSLGYGDYLTFLETHISLLPKELHDNLKVVGHKQFSFEVNLLEQQLVFLLSQASDSLWEDGIITKQRISNLLSRQYPFINFNVVEKGCLDNILHIIEGHKSGSASSCLLFSATLSGMHDSGDAAHHNAKHSLDCSGLEAQTGREVGNAGSFTTKDVVEVVLRTPMLIDLNSWLHWDIVYAPSLGPLLTWLLIEVNAKDLLCLLTRDGKVIRIDPSASVDSLYGAFLQGSPFQVAVELLSLFALFGGRRHLPLSLLKSRARQAFEVLLTNPTDGDQRYGNCLLNEKTSMKVMINENSGLASGASISMKQNDVKEPTFHASRLVLDCLGYIPSEFHSLAADILLSGLQSVVKYAPSSVLLQCSSKQEHVMLHEIGFALGITEWIDDHQKVCPIIADQSLMLIPALPLGSLGSKVESENLQQMAARDDGEYEADTNLNSSVGGLEFDISVRDNIQDAPQAGGMKDAALVIESIRREEFGLDSNVENHMLKKQHARLGRALHCLSQELYSQDSHFLLELIQNADDNAYGMEVEPTLIFILQNSRIIVLNNELGFTDQNIRALCDIGNSTKRGSSGYIGQKGIGFKSVFRVTDSPEIHSNGFHIKFDITEGQIGFVLPTIVPPCNTNVIRQLASASPDQMDYNCWNTCIVLPLRSNLTEGLEMGKIISMFSDIHPSLLLFIHQLRCIKLINMLDDSLFVMRKEIIGDGLVKVTYGQNAMTWFIASKKLFPEIVRPGVQVTEISVAITLKEYETGNYESHLEQQPVFAFLPLRTYGLKFILQGDFVLPTSREEVDGDSPWNQWLLSEFPNLFVSAEKQFCALPCFRENPGKAVTAYMDFVPLIGEVHGFFSCLPRMIISRLRQSDCLLQEGNNNTWVPPCRVLRNWNEQARMLLPDVLLQQHLGLSFLDKDIILSDQLARALSIQDYGSKLLVQCMSSICSDKNGLKSMGSCWLASWLNELHNMLHSQGRTSGYASLELDLIDSLKKVPCVPLSDGTYGSVNEGTIWINTDSIRTGSDRNTDAFSFPRLYASMRIVNPCLISAASEDVSCMDANVVNNVASMLHKIGVQHLTAHQMIMAHILPIISDDKIAIQDKSLFIECTAFVMLHFQFSCADCRVEKDNIISELQSKALLFTNLGFERLSDTTIHFGKEFECTIDASKFISGMDYKWHEIDGLYLKFPLTESVSCGLMKWREFFHGLGVIDFVKVTQVQRKISDITPIVFQQVKWDSDLISSDLLIIDWESQELDCLISLLARNGDHSTERSKYLLEVLDILWDDYFSDKTACNLSYKSGKNIESVKSSLMNNICDVSWVTSSMDDGLHYPRELFYDCDAVRSILGSFVPYATPKIRNGKLLTDIGFKTQVTIDDILASLQKWKTLEPFKASVSQMSRLYTLISKEPASSKRKAVEALSSAPFIFVPRASGVSPDDVVVGSLFSPEEVYWRDYSGALNSMTKLSPSAPDFPVGEILCDIYPGLQDFFVDDCGVNETPPFRYYLHILKQLSMNPSPLYVASSVFKVFLRWSDGLQCGSMVDGDIFFLRDHLLLRDFTVLPTRRNKWVSLHPSFGVICWSDDDSLKNQFQHSDSIQFLNFGELTDDEKDILRSKVSVLMQKLGIPALSEIVTREAIYYGPTNSSSKAFLVDWALPFAQRYIYTVHNEKYAQLKLSAFEKLQCLKIVVVEKLLFRNVVKRCGASSKKQYECSCLLQDTVLYATQESTSHSLFMELSCLFFNGAPELHLANLLHMLATMAESGLAKEQVEYFILNSQKIPKIPEEESVWFLSSALALKENDGAPHVDSYLTTINDQNSFKSKDKKALYCWPSVGWKNAPGFDYGLLPTRGMMTEPSCKETEMNLKASEVAGQTSDMTPMEVSEDFVIEDEVPGTAPFSGDLGIHDAFGISEDQPNPASEQAQSGEMSLVSPTSIIFESHSPAEGTVKTKYDPMTPDAQKAINVGRLGELLAFQHLKDKHPTTLVNWVNEQNETGLPYDIVIGEDSSREYIEVKATRYESKNWFQISTSEWQFAAERGDRYSVVRVVLSNKDAARITVYKNPVRLCQLGRLELAVMVPRQQQPGPSVLPR